MATIGKVAVRNIAFGPHSGTPLKRRRSYSACFILIRAFLGVILLADVTFKAIYRDLQEFPLAQSGLSPLNPSLVKNPGFQYEGTADFWWELPSMLAYSYTVPPIRCSGDNCRSYFFSAPLSVLKFQPGSGNITSSVQPLANTIIEKNSTGYQVDFSAIDVSKETMSLTDCRVYGQSIVALQLCLKKTNDSSFLAGIATLVQVR
jgi:hypothetical protein